jgi:ABC-type multidrug transport system fused ATPase/permease subunit
MKLSTLLSIIKYSRPEWKYYIIGMMAIVLEAVSAFFFPLLTQKLIDNATGLPFRIFSDLRYQIYKGPP